MSQRVGTVLANRYEIKAEIGSGGMGAVYLAYDHQRGCLVAIKQMHGPVYDPTHESVRRFRREAKILLQIKHPHIVSVYAYEEQAYAPFLVLEYIDGQSLEQKIRAQNGQPFPLAEALHIVSTVGWAVNYVHLHGVYHRDIKPSNILLDAHGKPYLADFGIALLTGEDPITRSSHIGLIGTPSYAAPEQWRGEEADARTDVYALGLLLYELLTGLRPFSSDDFARMYRQVLEKEPPPPRRLNSQISVSLEAIILKALSKERANRYDSVQDMLRALEGEMVRRRIPRQNGQPAPNRRRGALRWHNWLFLALGTLIVLLLLLNSLIQLGVISWSAQPTAIAQAEWTRTLEPTHTQAAPSSTPLPTATPTDLPTATQTLAPTSTPTSFPTRSSIPTATPTSLPEYMVQADSLTLYKGPSLEFEVLEQVRRGDRLPLTGRTLDGRWWRVNLFGREGWMPAETVPGADQLPIVTPSFTPRPTLTATPTATQTLPSSVPLANAGFEGIQANQVPGWQWWAFDNYAPGGTYDPETSYDAPALKQADDPARTIHGATLQIDAGNHRKFRVHVYQRVQVPENAVLRFHAFARAYSDSGGIYVSAGIDPSGGFDCTQAIWNTDTLLDQQVPVVQVTSRQTRTHDSQWATVCLRAETHLPARSNAAFFDSAELLVVGTD